MTFAGLAVSGCATLPTEVPGALFCDIAEADRFASQEVVDWLLENDIEHLRADLKHNAAGREECDWKS